MDTNNEKDTNVTYEELVYKDASLLPEEVHQYICKKRTSGYKFIAVVTIVMLVFLVFASATGSSKRDYDDDGHRVRVHNTKILVYLNGVPFDADEEEFDKIQNGDNAIAVQIHAKFAKSWFAIYDQNIVQKVIDYVGR